MNVHIELRSFNRFPEISHKWNSNDDVAGILLSAHSHAEWLKSEVVTRPPSGAQLLYSRKDGSYYKQDGYVWKRRKDGKLPREDHMKLKVRGVELIYANYVHSAIVPTFHRRAYWLLSRPDVVLVHYLNVSQDDGAEGRPLKDRILGSLRHQTHFTKKELLEQLKPMLASPHTPSELSESDLESLVASAKYSTQPDPSGNPPVMVIQSPPSTQPILFTLRQPVVVHQADNTEQTTHLAVEESAHTENSFHSPLGRSSSCSSASRRGLSSLAMQRQPSALSDSVDDFVLGGALNAFLMADTQNRDDSAYASSGSANVDPKEIWQNGRADMNTPQQQVQPSPLDNFGLSTVPVCHPSAYDEQQRQFTPQRSDKNQAAQEQYSVTTSTSALSNQRISSFDSSHTSNSNQASSAVAEITDFSPEWSFSEKTSVESGNSSMDVPCSSDALPDSLVHSLIGRLEFMERYLNIAPYSQINNATQDAAEMDLEVRLVAICNRMSKLEWLPIARTDTSNCNTPQNGMCLLHLGAALGYSRLVAAVLRWRAENPSSLLESEANPLSTDSCGRTPLFLACLNGHDGTAKLLADYSRSALDMRDNGGELPAEVAQRLGYNRLAMHLAKFGKITDSTEMDPTAMWVLTDGESITSNRGSISKQRRACLRPQLTVGAPDALRAHARHLRDIPKRCSLVGGESSEEGMSRKRLSSFDSKQNESTELTEGGELGDGNSEGDWLTEPLSVEIPMDVQVPDSPGMDEMWEAVTSPGIVASSDTRAQFASLAQQIIDALPDRIKQVETDMGGSLADSVLNNQTNPFLNGWDLQHNGGMEFRFPDTTDEFAIFPPLATSSPFADSNLSPCVSPAPSVKELGAFFSSNRIRNSPLERDFQELRLTDREQRELYEAAKVIQAAYRHYKARVVYNKQSEDERRAAVVIQSYYRRYKQYCYFKTLHNAAVLIQKHFRLYKAAKVTNGDSPSKCIRLQVSPGEMALWKQHVAAVRIQHAFRGHYMRKRQAAARKIQKFMRESRKKLQKIQELNVPEDATLSQNNSQHGFHTTPAAH